MHVEYRGIDGHIYDLWWQNGWNVNDLTASTNAQTAAGDPSGYLFDAQGTQHVVYLGTDNHIHELYWENGWSTNDLTAATNAQTAAGNPNGYVFTANGVSGMHVVYRGIDSHIHELYWQNGDWNVNDLTTATDAMLAAGDPNGFVFAAEAQMHVVYRGTDNHIYDLWWQNGWNVNDLTAATNAPAAAVGNPSGYVYDAQSMMHVAYRGIDNHIYDLWWQNGWNVNDLTAGTNAPAAVGDPNGCVFDAQGTQHVVYRGSENDIHELYWENGWSVNDLTAATNAPAAAGDPDGFVFAALEQMHVVYRAADSHIHEFWWASPEQSTGSKVLNFLQSISGSQTVAGQHNREPISEPAMWTDWIYNTTGKYPGLWSSDFLYEQPCISNRATMINEAITQWQQGALINLMYHACPPTTGEPCAWQGGVLSSLTGDQWNELITDGSDLNNNWKARLDVISVFLQDLQDNGVEVLWRPLHEMNQGNFWWGGRPGPQGTARLYQITHDYMVGVKGLTNLIWVWDVQDLDFNWAPYNPGDSYWDVLALDIYGADGYTTEKYQTLLQLAGDKPIAIGECEVLPTADELAAQPRWTFFMAWAELVSTGNSVQQIQALYNAANVISLDHMPGWG
ncbi:MAG: hypothetical protein JOZ49_13505 [Mycolicibacterium sp.]|nr:hypothetical protein [Mycolicibacterium sp.]